MPSLKSRHLERRQPVREEKQKVLIVCEGSKTEKFYFDAIRRSLRLSTVQVPIYYPNGTNPRLIVSFAIQKQKEQKADGTWNATDSAWAVYDGVEHFRNNPTDWHEALNLAHDHKINLAISNPSFELYYLLHYQDQNGWLERDAVKSRLENSWIKNYDKGKVYYPDPLKPLTRHAIERARKLARHAKENDLKLLDYLCAEGVAELVTLLHGLGSSPL